ncbi:MAG: hypothetical protein RL591_1785 [Planctomycetota bacterium]
MLSSICVSLSLGQKVSGQAVSGQAASAQAVSPLPDELRMLSPDEVSRILRMTPMPAIPADPSNRFAESDAAARLGHALFFEKALSPRGVSCATCHQPERYFTDGNALAQGVGTARRNAPTIVDAARRRWVGWDGKFDSLWSQALAPIEHPDEMGSDRRTLLRVVRDTPSYRLLFERAFGPFPNELAMRDGVSDPLATSGALPSDHVEEINSTTALVLKALGAYQRRVLSTETPLDRFVASLKKKGDANAADASDESKATFESDTFGAAARRGLAIFVGRGGCWQCHRGPNFTDEEFHALGLVGANGRVPDDPAREAAVTFLKANPFNVAGAWSDAQSSAKAAMVRGLKEGGEQFGQFRTPPLRGVALTPPYMHDGRFATLSDVVRFYDTLEGASPAGHHGEMVLEPLGLTEQERSDLVAFLESLNPDMTILRQSEWWRDPTGSPDRNGTTPTEVGPSGLQK